MAKVNQRGAHTTVLEGLESLFKAFTKIGVAVSPGVIQANAKSKGRSIKLKKFNEETFEMVVVIKSSKQTFKVYGKNQKEIVNVVDALKKDMWNVQAVLDMSK